MLHLLFLLEYFHKNIELFDNPENAYSDGTEENPYLISQISEEESNFGNIKYRLQKPSYQFSFKLIEKNASGQRIETQIDLSEADKTYHFKQTEDIVVKETQLLLNPENGVDMIFNSIYDGSYKTLTWEYDLSKDSFNKGRVSLFDKLDTNSKI